MFIFSVIDFCHYSYLHGFFQAPAEQERRQKEMEMEKLASMPDWMRGIKMRKKVKKFFYMKFFLANRCLIRLYVLFREISNNHQKYQALQYYLMARRGRGI